MAAPVRLPSHALLAWPLLVVLRRSPIGLTNREMEHAVADEVGLTAEQRALLRGGPRSRRTLLDYRLAWARTLLKNLGAVANDRPAHWIVTEQGHRTTEADIQAATDAMLAELASRKS